MYKFKFIISFALLSTTAYSRNIADVRSLCNDLTNESVTTLDGYPVVKRKDQLLIHVRQLCEDLELADDEKRINDEASTSRVNELQYIRNSWIQKFKFEEGIGIFDIMMMGASHQFSLWLLRFDIPKSFPSEKEVKNSPFWNLPRGPRSQEFDRKATEKGISPKFQWAKLEEMEIKGSAAKAHITDLSGGNRWLIKWGDEVHSDPVAARLFSALGFNTDYPYYLGPGEVNVILGKTPRKKKRTVAHFVRFIYNGYKINLSAFIKSVGKIDRARINQFPDLAPFRGQNYISFKSAAIEARPKSELRLGGMLSGHPKYSKSTELRGVILAHAWLGNWDIKEINSLLAITIDEKNQTQLIGSFSDLGISLGVKVNKFPRDVKAGLINEFPWDLVNIEKGQIHLNFHINAIIKTYTSAEYSDLHWMANQIAQIDEATIRNCLSFSGWPAYIQELYFFKLAERRRQILAAFLIEDPHPMTINRLYSYQENDDWLVKDGFLVKEPNLEVYPEGLFNEFGRFRGFRW